MSSCNCSRTVIVAPVNPDLPSITDSCPEVAATEVVSACEQEDLTCATSSTGYVLPTGWDDPVFDHGSKGIRILGRLGRKLAAFRGNGFLRIKDGLAFVVSSVPLRVSQLWHQWFKPTGINKRPILGSPYPFKNGVVADELGNLYAIKGLTGESITTNSSQYWDREAEQWDTREDADVPLLKRGLMPTATALELVGFEPIATSGASTDVRELKVLAGTGIPFAVQQPTIPASCDCEGCEPVAAVATKMAFLPPPEGEGTYKLQCVVDEDGAASYEWVEDDD